MATQEALHALGVRNNTLSDEEKFKLDHDGFVRLDGILEPAQIADMLLEFGRLFELEKTAWRPSSPGVPPIRGPGVPPGLKSARERPAVS